MCEGEEEIQELTEEEVRKNLESKEGWAKFLLRLKGFKKKIMDDAWETKDLTVLLDVFLAYYEIKEEDMWEYYAGSISTKLVILDKLTDKDISTVKEIMDRTLGFSNRLFLTYRITGDWIFRYAGWFLYWITTGDLLYLKEVMLAPYESVDPFAPPMPFNQNDHGAMYG